MYVHAPRKGCVKMYKVVIYKPERVPSVIMEPASTLILGF